MYFFYKDSSCLRRLLVGVEKLWTQQHQARSQLPPRLSFTASTITAAVNPLPADTNTEAHFKRNYNKPRLTQKHRNGLCRNMWALKLVCIRAHIQTGVNELSTTLHFTGGASEQSRQHTRLLKQRKEQIGSFQQGTAAVWRSCCRASRRPRNVCAFQWKGTLTGREEARENTSPLLYLPTAWRPQIYPTPIVQKGILRFLGDFFLNAADSEVLLCQLLHQCIIKKYTHTASTSRMNRRRSRRTSWSYFMWATK